MFNFKTLYCNSNYKNPIEINNDNNKIFISSSYNWNTDIGILNDDKSIIKFNKLGTCNIINNKFHFDNNDIWEIDKRKNILFIGANDMKEIYKYNAIIKTYNKGLFIEAIPDVFEKLKLILNKASNEYNGNYKGINALVSDLKNKKYLFNVFNNKGASSSIYEPTELALKEWKVHVVDKIELISTTIEDILTNEGWNNIKYDVILDVQGAELDVLKGFGEINYNNIDTLTVEISQKEYYKNGVQFTQLHNYIMNHGFKLLTSKEKIRVHGDVKYKKIN